MWKEIAGGMVVGAMGGTMIGEATRVDPQLTVILNTQHDACSNNYTLACVEDLGYFITDTSEGTLAIIDGRPHLGEVAIKSALRNQIVAPENEAIQRQNSIGIGLMVGVALGLWYKLGKDVYKDLKLKNDNRQTYRTAIDR